MSCAVSHLHGEVCGHACNCDLSGSRPISRVHLHLCDVTGRDPATPTPIILILIILSLSLVLLAPPFRLLLLDYCFWGLQTETARTNQESCDLRSHVTSGSGGTTVSGHGPN